MHDDRSPVLAACVLAAAAMLGCGPGALDADHPLPASAPNAPQTTADHADDRPSVVLISLDTVSADHLGCYGSGTPTTPHLDRFAASAVRFDHCRSQAVWTLPSHMSVFTSQLPSDHGVDDLHKVLPAGRVTLAETLREAGYHTAALVNDGQMKAHWGFDRGFDDWREFPVDTPAGDCEHITNAARAWLAARPAGRPFFLFLHYYDAHDPYAAPAEFRRKLGTSLSGDEARALAFEHRGPERNIDDPRLLADLVAAYDAGLAWLDRELGRLLEAIPSDAIVVIFADHGEAFEEHGWTLHGAALYEEDVRVPLLVRPTGARRGVVPDNVMLLDVAPTICAACGVPAPAQFGGIDLAPGWKGEALPERVIPAETTAVLEGRVAFSLVAGRWKGIYSPLDGLWELYQLPDETTNRAATDRPALDALRPAMRAWIEQRAFWRLDAVGDGDYEATLESLDGPIGSYVPAGFDPERDEVEASRDRRTIRWHVYPTPDRPRALLVEAGTGAARIRVDAKINGRSAAGRLFVGPGSAPLESLPAAVSPDVESVSPYREGPIRPAEAGFHLVRHATGASPRGGTVRPLDEETLRALRALGYVR